MTPTISTTRSRRAVATAASGALALALLLTGCTSGGDSDDEASQGATGGSGGGSSAAAGDGEPGSVKTFASCDEVGEVVGDALDGLALRDESTVVEEGFSCAWSSAEMNEEGNPERAVFALAQAQEFDADVIEEQANAVAASGEVTPVDDARASDVQGRAFVQNGETTGLNANGGTVVTPHGIFTVTATTLLTLEPSLSGEEALDSTFALMN
ncbi:hypothetical protein [uncultured Frigoribacterium sp.]|uniref:hypothetical protein n=1 Tax=uncultured Frigoribacterium sp. TaxID=335377 RepID=UPI0028D85662|nr:hypothetical protein [uncultured Frigoribacterium sp.]